MNDSGRRRRPIRYGLVLCALVAAGCSAGDRPRPATDRSPAPSVAATATTPGAVAPTVRDADSVVQCAHVIGFTTPERDNYRVVLDVVALPAAMLEPHPSGEPGWLFAKQGLVVRPETPVEIAVAPQAAGRVRIGWGNAGPEGTTIRVPACPSGGGWLAFAGGYLVREPVCVPLIVRARGRQEQVGVSVGARC